VWFFPPPPSSSIGGVCPPLPPPPPSFPPPPAATPAAPERSCDFRRPVHRPRSLPPRGGGDRGTPRRLVLERPRPPAAPGRVRDLARLPLPGVRRPRPRVPERSGALVD